MKKLASFISIFALIVAASILIHITIVTPAHALTRYYNCIARVANKNATLSISNVDNCYNMIFKGALDYYGIKQQQVHAGNSIDSTDHPSIHATESQTNKFQQKSQSNDIFG